AQKLARDGEKRNTERLVALPADGEPRRHGVAAVLLEVVPDAMQRGVQVEARDAPPRAAPHLAPLFPADAERWSPIPLHQAGGAGTTPPWPDLIGSPARPAVSTSARTPVQCDSASSLSPWRTRMRFSPVSGTTSATVASATRSRKWSGRWGDSPNAGTSACASLNATPVPHRSFSSDGQSARRGSSTAEAGGSASPGRW